MLVTTTSRDAFLETPDPSAGLGAVVVIPTFNEAATVASILRRVLGLPGDFAIIVVDDGSPDGTAEIVREIRRDAMRHLKELVDNGEVGADDEHRAEGRVQELTDEHTKHIDELLKHKEAEVMEV